MKGRAMAKRVFPLGAVIAAAACGVPTARPGGLTNSERVGCEEWGCGTNSASLGEEISFHDLDITGHQNKAQVVLRGLYDKAGHEYQIEIHGDELRARSGTKVRTDKELVDLSFKLEHMPTRQTFLVTIVGVRDTEFWVEHKPDRKV